VIVAMLPQRGKADSTKDVVVVNGPSQPVPVSGSIGVSGTVNANVTNTPNVNVTALPAVQLAPGTSVGISGTPGVNVLNQPTVSLASGTVVGVTNTSALQPVVLNTLVPLSPGQAGNNANAFTVPAGKRFVLEDISGSATLPTGQKLLDVALGVGGNPTTFVDAPITFRGTAATGVVDVFQFGRPARGYAEAGYTTFASVERDSGTGNGSVFVTVIGYLVNL
jgi:hypothetical protein